MHFNYNQQSIVSQTSPSKHAAKYSSVFSFYVAEIHRLLASEASASLNPLVAHVLVLLFLLRMRFSVSSHCSHNICCHRQYKNVPQ